jgi:D-alanyl-D-alanine carboxypeptidase/D-alanyl-D-alanine-endopeptidase (penicillin-binding protein 4)
MKLQKKSMLSGNLRWFSVGVVVWFILLAQVLPAQEAKGPATVVELRERLEGHVNEARFAAALWGAKVVSVDSGKVLFEHNAQKLFSPASNSKLYTVALALDRLGVDYRIKTSLYAAEKPDKAGVLKGDLIVYGRGDPTINARLHGENIFAALQPLVAALTNAGVRRIAGDLVGDDSFIKGPPYGSGWAWDDAENYYGAEISALTINDNTLKLTVKPAERAGAPCKLSLSPETSYLVVSNRTQTAEKGARRAISFYRPLNENVVYVSGQMGLEEGAYSDDVTVHNPAGLFVRWFKEALARNGVKVGGKARTMGWLERRSEPIDCEKLVELGLVESLPMAEIAREVMKPSQNLYTDLLLAQVGERENPNSNSQIPERSQAPRVRSGREETSEELGIRELNKFLGEAGVKRGDVLFEEGSGLSRNNLTTPNATVALLLYMNRHNASEAYLNALPIAGVDGTLRSRMKGTPAANNVRAKTGTLRWANSLSGHVTTAAGEHLIFSIMLNRYHSVDGRGSARGDIDVIPVWLAGLAAKTTD